MATSVQLDFFAANDLNGDVIFSMTDEDDFFEQLELHIALYTLGGGALTTSRQIGEAMFSTGIFSPEVFVRVLVPAMHETRYQWGFFLDIRTQRLISSDEKGGEKFFIGGPGPLFYLSRAILGYFKHVTTTNAITVDRANGVWRFAEDLTVGLALNRLLSEDAARDDPALPDQTNDFSNVNDSDGNPWTNEIPGNEPLELSIGDDYLKILYQLQDTEEDLIAYFDLGDVGAPEMLLHAKQGYGRNLLPSSATDFASDVVNLKEAVNIEAEQFDASGRALKKCSHVLVHGDEKVYVLVEKPGFTPGDYVKYGFLDWGRTENEDILERRGLRWLRKQDSGEQEFDLPIKPGFDPVNGLYFPSTHGGDGHIWIGDTVGVTTGPDGGGHTVLDYRNEPQRVTNINMKLREAVRSVDDDEKAKSWDVVIGLNKERASANAAGEGEDRGGTITSNTIKLCAEADAVTTGGGTYVRTHNGIAGTGGSIGVPWPSTDNGDLALLIFYAEEDRAVNTPSGFTLIDRHYDATADATIALFAKICDGTETGSLTITGSGWGLGQSKAGKFFIFADATIADISVPVYTAGDTNTMTAPTLSGAGLLALAFCGTTAAQSQSNFTGESGGDWTELADDVFVQSAMQLQSATISDPSISGGSKTISSGVQGWVVMGITLGTVTYHGQEDLIGTSGRAARCDHAHLALRSAEPTADDDDEAGYSTGTLWVVVDDTDTPTEVLSVWVSADSTDDAAVWLSISGGSTTDVDDLATSETDTTLVLHPDGAGGVEWGPDTAGDSVSDHQDLTGRGSEEAHAQYRLTYGGGQDVIQPHVAAGSTETLDLADGNVHEVTLTADCTLTLTGATAGVACAMRVLLRQGSGAPWEVTWPASVEWVGGSAPVLETAEGAWNWVELETMDGGTTWFADGGAASSFVAELDDLTDVTVTTPAEGDMLRFDGSQWVNTAGRWEPATDGVDTFVWDGDEIVMAWTET